jgi:RNA polymerase sigma factor (sigma-70 family)
VSTLPITTILQHLRQAGPAPNGAGWTDGQLLEAFVIRRDQSAFAVLLRRLGPMVWGVCRRLLPYHDAEDAFQATFVILARRAADVLPRDRVAGWLHGVACRTARRARARAARHHGRERQVSALPEPAAPGEGWSDLRGVIDEELRRLPEIYRLPLLLCDLEGQSIKAATRQLGWPQGTLAGRLSRGRNLLARRLTRRGIGVPAAALAGWMAAEAAAGVPPALRADALRTAMGDGTGQAVTGSVAALTEGELLAMGMIRLRTAMAAVLLGLAAVVALGSGWCPPTSGAGQVQGGTVSAAAAPAQPPSAQAGWPAVQCFSVRCYVVQPSADGLDLGPLGKGKVLYAPTLRVVAGQEARFGSGIEAPIPGGQGLSGGGFFAGVEGRIKVVARGDGSIRLEAVLEVTAMDRSDDQLAQASGTVLRGQVIGKIGEPIRLEAATGREGAPPFLAAYVLPEEQRAHRKPVGIQGVSVDGQK